MMANVALVVGTVVGLLLLYAGLVLMRTRPEYRVGAMLITAGGALFFLAQLYGLIVLRPFLGRTFDESWHAQLATVDAVGSLGLLLSAAGLVAHALRHRHHA